MDGITFIIIAAVVFYVIVEFFKPRRCGICNLPFKRKYYKWKIGGKRQYLCPGCSSRMDRKVSKERFEQRFGK